MPEGDAVFPNASARKSFQIPEGHAKEPSVGLEGSQEGIRGECSERKRTRQGPQMKNGRLVAAAAAKDDGLCRGRLDCFPRLQ